MANPETARYDEPNSPMNLAWQDDALCAQTDPEMFSPEKGGSTLDAKRICAQCEVGRACLSYALEIDQKSGIWGGLSARERKSLLGKTEKQIDAIFEANKQKYASR